MANWVPNDTAVPIWEDAPPAYQVEYGQPVPTIAHFPVDRVPTAPAVIVLPGGGYGRKAEHEAEPVARWLNAMGMHAFVLDYRVAPYRYPIPLLDARRSIQWVRHHANRLGVDPNRIGMLGFSAGGHLASTAGTNFEALEGEVKDVVGQENFHPNALILCYPVISFQKFRHSGSMENLLGADASDEQRQSLSNETQVSNQTPPTFLWHTANDASVPVENSLLFAGALSAFGIPFSLHIYPQGNHGLGMAVNEPYAGTWIDLCARWLDSIWSGKR